MITGPLKWHTVAAAIRDSAYAAMAGTPSGPPDRSCIVPGAIAWDECDCGLLAVSVNRIYRSEDFPAERVTVVGGQCDASFDVAEIVLQALRCAPNPLGDNLAPSCAELDASAQEVIRDAHDILSDVSVTLCEMKSDRDIVEYLVRQQTFVGPAGGCVGSELRVLVALHRD